MRKRVVHALAKADEALDGVLYRPAVVKAFAWLPRWWLCDLAKLSMRLADRWATGWWRETGIEPDGPCEACERRAAIHIYGGDEDGESFGDYLAHRPVRVCAWCQLGSPLLDEADVQRELRLARADSVAWRWRWRLRVG